MGLFKTKSEREVKRLNPVVQQILGLEDKMAVYSDEELRAQTDILKEELNNGKTLDEILPVAFAVCREAAWRVLGKKHFPVQLMGGIILHQGRIAEMCTGEGKTLVATLPSYLNALTGEGVHVVTVNDYLAARDAEQMGKVHEFLGLTVGVVLQSMSLEEKQKAYQCDITYCTNVELGFDYLRDNMVTHKERRMQRGHHFCIVDEIDSILIDEARTPLIISGPGEKPSEMYQVANEFAKNLKYKVIKERKSASFGEVQEEDSVFEGDADCIVEKKNKVPYLTAKGTEKAEKFFNVKNYADEEHSEIRHFVNQAIKAHGLMKVDVDYVVRGDKAAIDIVDEFTGRILEGRRFSEGLHQAIEAKEGVVVNRETKTLATVTYQNFFRKYKKLSGMTGTAMTEEEEFKNIYGIDVVSIPTNMPVIRNDEKDALYRTEQNKLKAVVEEIKAAFDNNVVAHNHVVFQIIGIFVDFYKFFVCNKFTVLRERETVLFADCHFTRFTEVVDTLFDDLIPFRYHDILHVVRICANRQEYVVLVYTFAVLIVYEYFFPFQNRNERGVEDFASAEKRHHANRRKRQ